MPSDYLISLISETAIFQATPHKAENKKNTIVYSIIEKERGTFASQKSISSNSIASQFCEKQGS